MKKIIRNSFFIILTFFILTPFPSSAHQPRIVENAMTTIAEPEVSQAFYGELTGEPKEFRIRSEKHFELYVGLLVPDIPNVQKNISAEIYQINGKKELLAFLDGDNFTWSPFYEEFGKDNYFWGPEYEAENGKDLKGRTVPSGEYIIKVFNPTNSGKYVLVTGFQEIFPPREILSASILVPRLKAQFFNHSLTELISSPYVYGYILTLFALAFVFGFLSKVIVRKFSQNSVRKMTKNIGAADRWVRASIGVGLFLWAVFTTWNPILLFFSGFCFFEALFSWCGFYSLLGKNTCPL